MVAVDRGSLYSELECPVCHERLKPGDRVLASFKAGKPRAVHAHPCTRPRTVAVMAAEAHDLVTHHPAA